MGAVQLDPVETQRLGAAGRIRECLDHGFDLRERHGARSRAPRSTDR